MSQPTRRYNDLQEHLGALAKAGMLLEIDRPIDKDCEMHPLVRWQFRGGVAESERRAFLFKSPVNRAGRRYDIPVVVGALAASQDVYSIGMQAPVSDIGEKWQRAFAKPIKPRPVNEAVCVMKKGPGSMPWIIRAPIRMAVTGSPGMPSVKSGIMAPPVTELFATSQEMTPFTSPLP